MPNRKTAFIIALAAAVAMLAASAASGCTYRKNNDPVVPVWTPNWADYYGPPHAALVEFTSTSY